MEDDDYGSDGWGEIDYRDLIAAADEVEKQATPSKPQQHKDSWGSNSLIFMDEDFDDFGDDEMLSAAVPSIAISTPNPQESQAQSEANCRDLASSTEMLRADEPQLLKKEEEKDVQPIESRDPKPEAVVVDNRPEVGAQRKDRVDEPVLPKTENGGDIAIDRMKRKITDQEMDSDRTRRKIEYSGTIFPRFTRAYEKDLADAVSVAAFSLRLMEILTSVLREFLEASISCYPRQHRIDVARDINRMVGHRKANASFQGWDFLALANFIIYHRNSLPKSIQKPHDIVERLRVLKTTMRWTVAHTSLQEEERKHPIELSLWAINTLFMIENLEVSMEYASKVMALHQRLWSHLPPPYMSQTD